jgi:hypothetical protein
MGELSSPPEKAVEWIATTHVDESGKLNGHARSCVVKAQLAYSARELAARELGVHPQQVRVVVKETV